MTKKRPTTIHDVARVASVSPSTVSRVLNGTTPVDEAKREAVLAAIDLLKYRPNPVAQGLVRSRSMIIGVITQDIASPFFGEILRGIEQGLHGSSFYPVCVSGNWHPAEEREALDVLIGRRADALIILGGQIPDAHLLEVAEQMPLIMVGRSVPGLEQQCLRIDDRAGAYMATQYLLSLGHREIAHITGLLTHDDAVSRYQGYTQALTDAGLSPNPKLIVEGRFSEASGEEAVEQLLAQQQPFSAIFAANDQMACGALLGLFNHGILVPHAVSLIGFDDLPGSAYTTPPLSTVRQPTLHLGTAAAQAVLCLLKDESLPSSTFPTELIIRRSTASHDQVS